MKNVSLAIIPILQKYQVKKASLFGSYAKGNYDKKSDIDILFEPPENMGLSVVLLQRELENKLKKKVDLVSYNGISKYLKQYILADQIPLI